MYVCLYTLNWRKHFADVSRFVQGILKNRLYCFLAFTFNFHRIRYKVLAHLIDINSTAYFNEIKDMFLWALMLAFKWLNTKHVDKFGAFLNNVRP